MFSRVLIPVLLILVAAGIGILVWQSTDEADTELTKPRAAGERPDSTAPSSEESGGKRSPPPKPAAATTAAEPPLSPAAPPAPPPAAAPAKRLALHLVSAVTGKPLIAVAVRIDGKEQTTDGDGRVFLPADLREKHDIRAAAHARARIPLRQIDEKDGRRVLPLYPGAAIHGQVRDGENRPLGRARVAAVLPMKMWATLDPGVKALSREWRVETDENGRFKLERLPASIPLTLIARPSDAPRIARENPVILKPREARVVHLVGAARGTITGRVVDQFNRAVPEARVSVREERGFPAGRGYSGRADKDGRFRFGGVACGKCSVAVSARSTGPKEARYEQVRVQLTLPGETRTEDVTVVVPRGLYVSGFVRAPDGTPITGSWVESRHVFWQRAKVKSGEDGAFTLGPLPGGPCRLWALRVGEYLTSAEVTVEPGTRDVVLTMQRGMVITGVAMEAGTLQPIAGCKLEAMPRAGGLTTSWGTSDKEGRFRMQSLRPGVYDLVARAKMRTSITEARADGGITIGSTLRPMFGAVNGITVGEGRASKDVRVELLPGGTLELAIDDRRADRSYDRFKGNYRVYVTRHGRSVTGRGSYYGNGSLIPVPAGAVRVVMTDQDDKRWKLERTVTVQAGKTVEVAFTVR